MSFEKGWHYDLLVELIEASNNKGSNLMNLRSARISYPGITREQFVKQWVDPFLNSPVLVAEFMDFINGKRSLESIADRDHILENILCDHPAWACKSQNNAIALSEAMQEIYPRHRRTSVPVDRLPETIGYSEAATLLNMTSEGVRKAARQGRLVKVGPGKVTKASILSYQRRRKRT